MIPVTFELPDPDRQWSRVTVAGAFNEWDADASPMHWRDGVWTRTFYGLEPGEYPYKFVAEGQEWMADPGNPRQAADGNSLITVAIEPTWNLEQPFDATRRGDTLRIDYHGPDVGALRAQMRTLEDEWRTYDLTREGDRWRGEIPLPEVATASPDPISLQVRYVYDLPFGEAWARTYTLQNFSDILTNENYPFGLFFVNSLVVATGCGIVTVILCLLAGYAFAVKEFWGRDVIFWLLFSSMLIPGLVFVVPQFAIITALGWQNSYAAMIFPHVANVFGLFLMRQYIMTMPRDLFAAARVDGATEWQVLRTIVVPLTIPITVTLFLLVFMMQWSNFLWQLIVNTPDSVRRTLPVGLALFRGQHQIDWELMMAGACFSVVPIALLFIVAQRYFIQGLTAGAVKG
jgi:multiple sugar transport system permease protein